jgi:hypothetical protein
MWTYARRNKETGHCSRSVLYTQKPNCKTHALILCTGGKFFRFHSFWIKHNWSATGISLFHSSFTQSGLTRHKLWPFPLTTSYTYHIKQWAKYKTNELLLLTYIPSQKCHSGTLKNTAYTVTSTCLMKSYNMSTDKHISEDFDHPVPWSPTRVTSWTALKQDITWLTIYQSTNINKDFSSKYNTSHWQNGLYGISTTTKPPSSSPNETPCSYVIVNKTLRFLLLVFDTAPSVVGMMGKQQDTATLMISQHGGLLTTNLIHGFTYSTPESCSQFWSISITGNTSTNLPAWFKIKRHFVDNR